MRIRFAAALLCFIAVTASAQNVPTSSVLGAHNLSGSSICTGQNCSPITGGLPPCYFCHAPHNASPKGISPQNIAVGLWSQQISMVQNYTLYSSSTLTNQTQQPVLGQASNLCLSCHDGTVAPGQTSPWGKIQMSGSMNSQDVFGRDLSAIHPFNFALTNGVLKSAPSLLPSLTQTNPSTGNPAVKLINGNVQCESCHNAHVQTIDSSNMFLVVDNTNSALCQACHSTVPTNPIQMATKKTATSGQASTSRAGSVSTTTTSYNPLTAWSTSAHAQAGNQSSKSANVGPYTTVRRNGCMSCHTTHNAQGGGALLNPAKQTAPNLDASAQTCINCHNGGSAVSPAITNVYQEFSKKGHPFPTNSNPHSLDEGAILNKNRHATCVDCHEPHAAQKTASFESTAIRGSQDGAQGISAVDGVTVVNPALNQYEVCFRCHAGSTGKQALAIYGYLPTRLVTGGDALNLVPPLSKNAISSHPVTHDRQSPLPQPSLLKCMWNLDGRTQGRLMGARLLCTDCHNSDDNREFGGSGPNGPHGSQYSHILERRYEFSQVAPGVPPMGGPGTAIQNLLPVVLDPGANGPYSLCQKCHDLANILSNASFSKHSLHISAGFSCSVCHSAHGVPNATAGLSGDRLVNFDIAVVAQNDILNTPIAYNRVSGTCTLKCHNYNHNQDGTVTLSQMSKLARTTKH